MSHRPLPLVVAALIGVITWTAPARAAQAPEGDARDAALVWVALVDGERYADSWTAAAGAFKRAVTQDQWETAASRAREPFGALQSRTVSSSRATTSLPGAPDGEYVVLQFQTAFARKAAAVETIVMAHEPDGAWRVSGYFVR